MKMPVVDCGLWTQEVETGMPVLEKGMTIVKNGIPIVDQGMTIGENGLFLVDNPPKW